MHELWKTIDEYPNYELSICGNVRNISSGHNLSKNRYNKNGWPYQMVLLRDCDKKRSWVSTKILMDKYWSQEELQQLILNENMSNSFDDNNLVVH